MPVSIPHTFATLRKGARPSILLAGSGLSAGMVPLPAALIQDHGQAAESILNISTGFLTKTTYVPDDLYEWADLALDAIVKRAAAPIPKLALAVSLGIHTDKFAVRFTTAQSKPRHRILARLVREGLIQTIWTTNWDCNIENALQRSGIKPNDPIASVPWKTSQKSIVVAAELGGAHAESVKIWKPHGCARSILEASDFALVGDLTKAQERSDRFLIGKKELMDVANVSSATYIYRHLEVEVNEWPFFAIGWSASEEYLVDHLEAECKAHKTGQTLADDELSVVALDWSAGHDKVASIFKSDQARAFVQVEKFPPNVCSDKLMRWIYSLFALDYLINVAAAGDKALLIQLRTDIEFSRDAIDTVLDWFDFFLTAWVRFCCRQGYITFYKSGVPLDLATVPMECPEETIPMNQQNRVSKDVAAASRILAAMLGNNTLGIYDYNMCPGGLLQGTELTFMMPFDGSTDVVDLRSDREMDDSWDKSRFISVRICMVPMQPGQIPSTTQKKQAKGIVSRVLNEARFVNTSKFRFVEVDAL